MITTLRSTAAAALALVAFAPLAVDAQTPDLNREIQQSQRRLEQIREERARLEREVGDVRNRVRNASQELANVERRLSASRSVLAEVERWWAKGQSCFAELAERWGLSCDNEESILDRVLPNTS